MQNPISTISSIAFAAVAILIAYHDAARYSLLIASLVVLAAGSWVFHAKGEVNKTPEHYADKGAIYVVAVRWIEPQKDWIHGLWHVLVSAAVGVAWWVIHFR